MHNKNIKILFIALFSLLFVPRILFAKLNDTYVISNKNDGGSDLNVGTVTIKIPYGDGEYRKVYSADDCDSFPYTKYVRKTTYYTATCTAPANLSTYVDIPYDEGATNINCNFVESGKGSDSVPARKDAANNSKTIKCTYKIGKESYSAIGTYTGPEINWLKNCTAFGPYTNNTNEYTISSEDLTLYGLGWTTYETPLYYCKTYKDLTTSNTFHQGHYITNDYQDAYCLHPGKAFPTNGVVTQIDNYDTSSCQTSNQSYECRLAAIATKSKEENLSYTETLMALRTMAAGRSGESGFDEWWDTYGDIYRNASFYKDTFNYYILNNGSVDSAPNGVIRGNNIEKVVKILREIENGYNFWEPKFEKVNQIENSGYMALTYKTSFSIKKNLDIKSVKLVTNSKETNLQYSIKTCNSINLAPCDSNYYYLIINVPISEYKNSMNVYIDFDYDEYAIGNIGIYTSNENPDKYQYFFVFDRNASTQLHIEIPNTKRYCIIDNDKYYGLDGNEITGTLEEKKTKYKEQCGCRKIDGVYYGLDGVALGSDTSAEIKYDIQCDFISNKTVCGYKDGKYYDIYGNETTYAKMKGSCYCTYSPITKQYYGINSTPVTSKEDIEFVRNGCKAVENDKCFVTDKNDVPTDCNSDTEGVIEDPEMCSILNPKTSETVNADKYKTSYASDNSYCTVYCRNEFRYQFMNKTEALAGRYFYYDIKHDGSRLSTVVKTIRECASIIDYNKWLEDYNKANQDVLDKYNAYAAVKAQELSAEAITSEEKTCEESQILKCGCNDGYYAKKLDYKCWDECIDPCVDLEDDEQSECAEPCDEKCTKETDNYICTDWDPGEVCEQHDISCTAYIWKVKYQKTNNNGLQISTDASGSSSCTATCGVNCNGCKDTISNGTPPNSAQQLKDYNDAVDKRNALLEKIKSCNFGDNTSIYNKVMKDVPSNTINITYEEPYNISTSVETITKRITKSYTTDSDWTDYCNGCDEIMNLGNNSSAELNNWSCSNDPEDYDKENKILKSKCTNIGVEVPKNKVAAIRIEKEDGYFQATPFAANIYTGVINNSVGTTYNISLGKRLYPVSRIKTTNERKITVQWSAKNIGGNSKNVGGAYNCYYNIVNESTMYTCEDGYHECPPGTDIGNTLYGLGYYFRTIDLENIFNTRTIPYNWATSKGQVIRSNIEEVGNNIWTNTKPIYSINLSSEGISYIKKYNKQQESSGGYLDYSLDCDTNTLRCKSLFLESLKNRKDITLTKNEKSDNIYYFTK